MTLRTPVIEMGVSNGAAVRADDLCEPIPPRLFLSFSSSRSAPFFSFSFFFLSCAFLSSSDHLTALLSAILLFLDLNCLSDE